MGTLETSSFEWDDDKDKLNRKKHGVPFVLAQYAFADPHRVILEDISHSTEDEKRLLLRGQNWRRYYDGKIYLSR